MRVITASLAAFLLTGVALAAPGDDWKEIESAFKQDFKKKSVKYKKMAMDGLPLDDERTIEFIVKKNKLLGHKDWWVRATACERLSKIKTARLRKILHSYAKDSDWRVREGILAALAMSQDKADGPVIVAALKDKDWHVRRMAAWAAGQQRIREAVEPMIEMINDVDLRTGKVVQEGEPHPRVHSILLFNLEEITGEYFYTDTEQWRAYWERNKDRTLPPVKRFDVGTFGDVKLKFNETFARKGKGPLVVCLPETGKSTTYYMPYFNQWNFVKWLFINLPPIKSFPDVEYDDGDPIYPVDILVDAFEDMRKKRNVEKMVLLAHEFSTWVAAKYAQKYPDRVAGLIFINSFASNETFRRRIDEAMRSGLRDDEFWAKVSSRQIKPGTALEGQQLWYFNGSALIADKSDIELSVLSRVWNDPGATSIVIPQFDIRGESTSDVPALLFFLPKKNKFTNFDDYKKLRKYYKKNVSVKLRKSASLPFMEEPEKFEEALRAFLNKYNIK
ncbi:MAG: HEAT repeat domain-containing protein [Planctomycetota bacterium]|jgi:pimeloyl-ACP methyl ester carboxylesterase